MIKNIKRIVQFILSSTRRKLILGFSLILIPHVFLSAYTLYSGKLINDIYNSSLEKHIQLNDIFVNIRTANNYLEEYLQTGAKEVLDKYNTANPVLIDSSIDFSNFPENETISRAAIDLKYMIQSYTLEANMAIESFQKNKRTESNKHYFEAYKITGLIDSSFKRVSSSLTSNTENLIRQINESKNMQYTLNYIFIIATLLLSIVMIQSFSRTVTKPLKRLTLAASKFSGKELNIEEVPVTSSDEIGMLTNTFNQMVDKIRGQVKEIKEKAKLERKLRDEEIENLRMKSMLKELELKSLQSRINPHFLFNSLNMITQMAYLEEAKQTTSLLDSMTELLRYNLDKFNSIVTMEDEVANVKDYLYIQHKRFGERIKFKVDVDKKANNCLIPCLIIQPLIENSFIHGVQSTIENGLVGLKVQRNKNRICIKVFDNGIGIEREKLNEIKREILKDNVKSGLGGIGLPNVITRLKLYYQNDVKIVIKSMPNEGTEIKIGIPAIEKEADNNVQLINSGR